MKLSSAIKLVAFFSMFTFTELGLSTELETIEVKAVRGAKKKQAFKYDEIKKTQKDITKQQVQDIRDLTRYDPGVSVNEQGQGTSAGYSMRGVDRNRVAVTVDGLPQAQVFSVGGNWHTDGQYGAAINEVEVENLKQVDIHKGTQSIRGGNGAMGGAVMFQTKDPFDLIAPGKNIGGVVRTGYIGKTDQLYRSIGVGATKGQFAGMFQYTHRQGHELQSHSDVSGQYLTHWYNNEEGYAGVSSARQEQYTKYYEAQDVFGPSRAVSNPLDFQSHSLLTKGVFQINQKHSLGIVFEKTIQDYEQLDLSKPVFSLASDRFEPKWTSTVGSSAYKWFRTLHKDNTHNKHRYGLAYTIQGDKGSELDSLSIKLDRQDIHMENALLYRSCAKNLSRYCDLSQKLGGQYLNDYYSGTQEVTNTLRIEAEKKLKTQHLGTHQMYFNLGWAQSDFNYFSRSNRYIHRYIYNIQTGTSRLDDSFYHREGQFESQPVKGHHRYLALEDNLKLNKYWQIPLAVRADNYIYKSDSDYVPNSRHNAISHSVGVVYKPKRFLELALNQNTGFRVPSYVEQYGFEVLYPRYTQKLVSPEQVNAPEITPEQSTQTTLGVTFKGDLGYVRLSHFWADYENLIGAYQMKTPDGTLQWGTYANVTDAYTQGIDFTSALDLYQLSSMFPEGLEARLSYSKVRPRKVKDKLDSNSNNFTQSNFVLDTIQPAKAVLGVGYTAPSKRWGVDTFITYSFKKEQDELTRKLLIPNTGQTLDTTVVGYTSESWHTVDVVGFKKIGQHATVRLGVYNVLNKKYTQWENLRSAFGQTGTASANTTVASGSGFDRLTAPGRNFLLTGEFKF